MMHKDKKVFVVVYAKQNVGDDLFLHILFSKFPDVSFGLMAPKSYRDFITDYKNVNLIRAPRLNLWEGIICKFEKLAHFSLFSKKAFLHNRRKYIRRRLAEDYNGFLHIGGSLFIQQAPGIRLNDLTHSIIPKYIPNSFIIGCNWGPSIDDTYLKFYASKVFPFYKGICFRDLASYNLFKDLTNVHYAPDVVFQYTPEVSHIKPKHIGISVMDLSKRKGLSKTWDSYVSKTSDAITRLHQEGYNVTLFSFCKFEGDEEAAKSIIRKLPQGVEINCVYYDGNLKTFLRKYAEMETMVTLRFHSLVLSLIMGQKICPLIYSNKVANLLSDIHYQGFSANLSEIGEVDLTKEIKESKEIVIPLKKYAFEAQKQFTCFEESYLNR